MKKYILYTLLLVFAANVGYAQDRQAIEVAKKRLLELRAKKAQIEEEMQKILQPDKIVTTEIKDGVRTQNVQTKTQETLRPSVNEVISKEEVPIEKNTEEVTEAREDKMSQRKERKRKRVRNSYTLIEDEKEETEETTVTIEQEEVEAPAIEIVEETPEVEIETEVEIEEPKPSRRERRRQKQIENTDIVIEEPEEVMEETTVTIEAEEPAVEIVVGENIEIELPNEMTEEQSVEEVEITAPKRSRRERRRQREVENIDIIIEEPEEVVEETTVTIEQEEAEAPAIKIVEETPEIKVEKPKAEVPKLEPEGEEVVMETPSTPEVEINILDTEFKVEENPKMDIAAKMPEVKIPPVVEVKTEEKPTVKLSRKERRKLRQTENFDIVIEAPEEAPSGEVVEEAAPKTAKENASVTVIKDPEEEAIIAEIENAAEQKTRLSIDVVDMPSAEPLDIRLSDEAAFAMTDILTATPPESVPPEVTFYDAKLKLIVGEMEALATKSALLPSGMKRINDKLTTIESQLLKFDDMRSEPETAKYMNFMQMNIDILQNIAGDSNANAPDTMLMEPEATPEPTSAPQGAQKVYFSRNSDKIGFRFGKELEALAATAKDIPGFYLIIDSMNESLQNQSVISKNRAENIRDFLQEEGVADEQIRSRYFGNTPDELTVRPAVIIQIVDN